MLSLHENDDKVAMKAARIQGKVDIGRRSYFPIDGNKMFGLKGLRHLNAPEKWNPCGRRRHSCIRLLCPTTGAPLIQNLKSLVGPLNC
jgi:hypothetical protein